MNIIRWLWRNRSVIVLGLFGAGVFYVTRLDKKMHERAKFTLGTIGGWYQTAKSGRYFRYSFRVADSLYRGSSGWESGMNEADGSPCLVEYDSLDPAQSVGHFAIAIPDSLRRPPANGWRVPPFPVPAWYLDHGRKQ